MNHSISHTLNVNITALVSNEPVADVPCGTCNACCKLLSPHLTPEEISSGQYPISFVQGTDGPVVVLYRHKDGGCGMLVNDKCSIYENRPIACRQFDCRKGHHDKTNIVAKEKFGIEI